MTQTIIKIDGISNPINFRDLNLDERVLSVNDFSFSWTPAGDDASLSAITKFKDNNLSKQVTIQFNDENGEPNHGFKGIITQISSNPNSDIHVSFSLSGSGLLCQFDGKPECNSFYQQDLMSIIETVPAPTIVLEPKEKAPIQYTVQYNQTDFGFIKMLAIRHGEWMFYDGKNLTFGGKPSGLPIKLMAGQDITNINIHAHAAKANENAFGFDTFRGELITGDTEAPAPSSSALLSATDKAGTIIFSADATSAYFSGAQTQKMLDTQNKLQQQAATAGSVFISASSHNSQLTVGSVIAITDAHDTTGKQFIIVEMHHSANNNHGYSNHFTAVPADVETPHYTNPWLYPKAGAQPAIVMDNEDRDGYDRIKVHFPWMKESETSPWIPMLTLHAGKDKGFRWLPEKYEEVMIDFIDGNVERPMMVGTMYTDNNKSGVDPTGNNLKMIGSRTGRKFEIDDKKGIVIITDKQGNSVSLGANGSSSIDIVSANSSSRSKINMTNNKINISLNDDGLFLKMDFDKKVVDINSTGDINILADGDIKMIGENVSISATKKLTLGTADGYNTEEVDINAQNIRAKADTGIDMESKLTLSLKSMTIQAKATMEAIVDGGTKTAVKGNIVMLN